jgi:hypothetical protein
MLLPLVTTVDCDEMCRGALLQVSRTPVPVTVTIDNYLITVERVWQSGKGGKERDANVARR